MNQSSKIVITNDGSHSIYLPEVDEHYHSVHGAIQESKHVFIEAGLKSVADYFSEIKLLEIGMGTGLNCFLTFLENENNKLKIDYTAIEAFPLDSNIVEHLNYAEQLNNDKKSFFHTIHTCEWNEEIDLSPNFKFKKIKQRVQEITFNQQFNLIYFDAFAPRVQPEMWSKEIFEKLYQALTLNGIITTYCAKGEVKRALKSLGFTVETLPGPPGKREMVRALK